MKIILEKLKALQDSGRFKDGFLDAVVAAANNNDGVLEISRDDYSRIFDDYKITAKTFRGLGDVVHYLAKPVAAASDAVFGTNLKGCAECASRREDWNSKYPISTIPGL